MKCDELEKFDAASNADLSAGYDHRYAYEADEVDEAIAELKGELKDVTDDRNEFKQLYSEQTEKLCIELTNVDTLEQELRKTLRALWLARAERAEARKDYWYARSVHEGDNRLWSIDGSAVKYIGCIKRTNFDWLKTWSEVECKCLKKAEEYK